MTDRETKRSKDSGATCAMERGMIVASAAGHDKGQLYLVVEAEERAVLLADGKNRPLDRPKRKNVKHVQLIGVCTHPAIHRFCAGERIENKEIRTALAIAARANRTKGGEYAWPKTT